VADAADHAAWNNLPVAAGGVCRKHGADRLGAAAVIPVLSVRSARQRAPLARVVVELLRLGGKPWVLAIDRTKWDFGKTTTNILVISVTWNLGSPLLWMNATNYFCISLTASDSMVERALPAFTMNRMT
jgi:hypothetical protein